MSYFTGALPSPPHKAFAVPSHRASAVPPLYGIIPSKLDIWGNSTYGDCCSAEEAWALAFYSLAAGLPETFVSANDVVAFARAHRYLNGAALTDVMDTMASAGMQSGSTTYHDGPYQSVDWTDDTVLSSAIYQGPVKIGVAAGQLQNVVQGQNGWFATTFRKSRAIDHCVGLGGFGTIGDLAELMKVPVPNGVIASGRGYLMFTWGTVGIISQSSMEAITAEAWLRTPTTVGVGPVPPDPGPQPSPTPNPTPGPTPGPTPTPPSPSPSPSPQVFFPDYDIVLSGSLPVTGGTSPVTIILTGTATPSGPPAPTPGPTPLP